jgi:hypothetical protein
MIPVFINILQDYSSSVFLHNDDSQLLRNNIVKEIYDPYLPKLTLNSWEDKNSNKIYSCNFIEQQDIIDRWIHLNLKFNFSFEQKKHLFPNVLPSIIENDFKKSLENVLSLFPEKISVGVSDDECVYIYFEKDNKSVYFDLFFEPEQETEASVIVFENKVSNLSFIDYLDNSINILKKEFVTEDELSFQTLTAI